MTIARVDPSYPVVATDWQVQVNGLVFGTGTPYKLLKVDGLGLPPPKTSDADRAAAHGSFGGQDFSTPRDIIFTIGVQPRAGDPTLAALLNSLRNAFSPSSADVALAMKLKDEVAAVFVGRTRRCETPYDILAANGKYLEAMAQFTALDPIKYGALLNDVVIGYGTAGTNAGFTFNRATPAATPGLAFNRATPASTPGAASDAAAGGAGAAGFVQLINSGVEATAPVSRIRAVGGPVTGPIHLSRVESGEDIMLNINLAANDVLELDHDLHSVQLNGNTNRADVVDTSTTWWLLQPGLNTAHYRSEGPGAGSSAEVLWRDAYW